MQKELQVYIDKLNRLKQYKEQEPNNSYHDWDKEIAQCEKNIADIVSELN